jgi:hypothetical protein
MNKGTVQTFLDKVLNSSQESQRMQCLTSQGLSKSGQLYLHAVKRRQQAKFYTMSRNRIKHTYIHTFIYVYIYVCLYIYIYIYILVALGGPVVSVLATGPKVRGFKPGRGRWILRVIKIRSTPSFGDEVKPSVPCRRFTACKRTLRAR